MSDYYNIIDTAVEAAEKRGVEKGKREIANRLMSMGMSDADIIVATGLSTEELNELKTA